MRNEKSSTPWMHTNQKTVTVDLKANGVNSAFIGWTLEARNKQGKWIRATVWVKFTGLVSGHTFESIFNSSRIPKKDFGI